MHGEVLGANLLAMRPRLTHVAGALAILAAAVGAPAGAAGQSAGSPSSVEPLAYWHTPCPASGGTARTAYAPGDVGGIDYCDLVFTDGRGGADGTVPGQDDQGRALGPLILQYRTVDGWGTPQVLTCTSGQVFKWCDYATQWSGGEGDWEIWWYLNQLPVGTRGIRVIQGVTTLWEATFTRGAPPPPPTTTTTTIVEPPATAFDLEPGEIEADPIDEPTTGDAGNPLGAPHGPWPSFVAVIEDTTAYYQDCFLWEGWSPWEDAHGWFCHQP